MPTIYGTQDPLEDIRSVVVAEMTALIAQMVTDGTDPAVGAAYSTHWATANLTFPSVSVGIIAAELKFPSLQSSPRGPLVDTHATVEIRVMIGRTNEYMDEIKIMRLCQSVVNWLQEHRTTQTDDVRLWDPMQVEGPQTFSDTDTIGGLVRLVMRRPDIYGAS